MTCVNMLAPKPEVLCLPVLERFHVALAITPQGGGPLKTFCAFIHVHGGAEKSWYSLNKVKWVEVLREN